MELLGCLFEGLFGGLFALLLQLALLLIFLIVTTPFILVRSLWSLPDYLGEVRFQYGRVIQFWIGLVQYG